MNKVTIKRVAAISLIFGFAYTSYVVKLYFATEVWHWDLSAYFGRIPLVLLTTAFYLLAYKVMKDFNYPSD